MSTSCKKRKVSHQTTLAEDFGFSRAPSNVDLTTSNGEEDELAVDEPSTSEESQPPRVDETTATLRDEPIETAPAERDEDGSRHSEVAPPPSEPSWRGVPLTLLSFGPSAYPLLPPAPLPSTTHSVLFRPGNPPVPFPDHFKDVWDERHVKMPCSKMSQYPVSGEGGGKRIVPRWQLIRDALTTKPIANSYQLADAILVYNSRYASRWRFNNLHDYFSTYCGDEEAEHFFASLLPGIIDLALRLPSTVTHALPLLRKQEPYQITMTQEQASCLLANAFLCTFPSRNTVQRGAEYSSFPFINFNGLFTNSRRGMIEPSQASKLACLFHYFKRVTSHPPGGTLSFERRVLPPSPYFQEVRTRSQQDGISPPNWVSSTRPLTQLHVDSAGTIEGCGHGMLQVDFANKYVGGGVLHFGCVQEEIRFLVCPELIVSMLFTEELDDNECLLVTGAEQYSTYRGYGSTFEWSGRHDDQTISDYWGRRQVQVVAMDALVITNSETQYAPAKMWRELNKAYCGFQTSDSTYCGRNMAVATGNWGCGAFGGDPSLKALLQLMAASEAGRDIVYFTFGNTELRDQIHQCYRLLCERMVTVGDVWRFLTSYHTEVVEKRGHTPLLPFIISLLEHTS